MPRTKKVVIETEEKQVRDLRKGGYLPDVFDARDLPAKKALKTYFSSQPAEYLETVKIVNDLDLVRDQGVEGACPAFAIASAISIKLWKECNETYYPSERWIITVGQLYDEWEETRPDGEEGSSLRGCLKGLDKRGIVRYELVPYVPGQRKMDIKTAMLAELWSECDRYRIDKYKNLLGTKDIKLNPVILKQEIISGGAVPVGMSLPEAFMRTGPDGIVFDNQVQKLGMHGFHAMLVIGWKKILGKTYFILLNSWGKEFGDKGLVYWEEESFVRNCIAAQTFGVMVYAPREDEE